MSEQKPEPSGNPQQPKFDQDLVKRFLSIQEQEILARQGELAFKGKDIDNQKEIALKSIEAQQADLKDSRIHTRKSSIIGKIFVLSIVVVIILLVIYLIEKGKDAIAIEIIKITGVAVISFGGGYFYGRGNSGSKPSNPNEQTAEVIN